MMTNSNNGFVECTACKGTGIVEFFSIAQQIYRRERCNSCDGTGKQMLMPRPLPFELKGLTREDKLELHSYLEWKPDTWQPETVGVQLFIVLLTWGDGSERMHHFEKALNLESAYAHGKDLFAGTGYRVIGVYPVSLLDTMENKTARELTFGTPRNNRPT